ncbi:decapping and exoribonuclease protein-like [Lytechinus variegatus]|uniref:decapping and exoribonuclease protein-like n=1 Tax=Lytechinus variegatus TaxID=7654 RepID=UPI001BB2C756|nr:decapping and exoribonuclease protein-like [Lytechinus variegatus]
MASSRATSRSYEVLGNFSIGEDREYHNDLSQRRFLVEPDDDCPNFDLVHGLSEYTDRKPSGSEPTSMNPMLHWLRDHRDELIDKKILKSGGSSRKLDIDFVGRRGFFCRLLRAAASADKLEILVTLCKGTYYIENVKDTYKETAKQIEMGFAGKKFAQYITSSDGSKPDINEPVNAYSEYVAVMKAQYGDHRIILSTEVQAEREDAAQRPPENYVCIKTRRDDLVGKQLTNFNRYKTLQWWSQAYMAGIPEVICGMRNDSQRIIASVKNMKTNQMSLNSEGIWEPGMCVKKFESYLSEIKRLVQDDNPRAVYRLQLPEFEKGRRAKDRLQYRRFHLLGKKDDYVIIPEEYIKEVLNLEE